VAEKINYRSEKSDEFISSVFSSLTIGVPFCIFKYLFGVLAVREGAASGLDWLIFIGWAVIVGSGIDLLMNLIRSILELHGRETSLEFCLIAQVGRFFDRQNLFLTFDTLLSFLIICFVLWSGWMVHLAGYEKYMWYGATTVNLVSLAIVNIWTELLVNSDKSSDR